MKYILLITLITCLFACSQAEKDTECLVDVESISNQNIQTEKKEKAIQDSISKLIADSILLINNLVDVQSIDSSIHVDLKYTTSDNFMKRVLYQHIKHAYLQKEVVERLALSQKELKETHPEYSLLIYDAVRPVSVQQLMWNSLDTIPIAERSKFVSNPKNKSLHNYGAAVDVTIIDQNGVPLDMGAGYDDMRKIAYPSFEWKYIASGELSTEQIENRKLLRKVMSANGFRNIPTEWWHFNACSRATAEGKYSILLTEPTE